MSLTSPLLISVVNGINRSFVKNKSFDYFRGIIDGFSKQEYMDMLEDFKISKRNRVSNYLDLNNFGYSKYRLFNNAHFEINMIEWEKNAKSFIHNHPPEGCIVKLIEGSLLEDKYLYNGSEKIKHTHRNIIVPIHSFNKTKTHSYYIDGLHRITNINNAKSYSLHFYSPEFIPETYTA